MASTYTFQRTTLVILWIAFIFQGIVCLNCPNDQYPDWVPTRESRYDVTGQGVESESMTSVENDQTCRLRCLRYNAFDCLSYNFNSIEKTCQLLSGAAPVGTLTPNVNTVYVEGLCKLTGNVSENCGTREQRVDLAFVVDGSGSICDPGAQEGVTCDNWQTVLDFLTAVAERLAIGPDGDRMAVILFANVGEVMWDLNRYDDKSELRSRIANLSYPSGNTNTFDGLTLTRTDVFGVAGDREGVRNLAVVLTDGKPTNKVPETAPEAKRMQDEGITMFAVGVTDSVDTETLKYLCSYPRQLDRNYFSAPNFDVLLQVIDTLLASACIPTNPPTTPSTITTPTTTTTTATTKTSSLSCTAGQGYLSDETLNKRLGGTPIDLNTYTTVVDMPQCRLLCGGHVGNCKSFIYNSQSEVCIIYAVDKTDYPLVDDAGFSYYDNLRCGFVTTTTTSATPLTPDPTGSAATSTDAPSLLTIVLAVGFSISLSVVLAIAVTLAVRRCQSGAPTNRPYEETVNPAYDVKRRDSVTSVIDTSYEEINLSDSPDGASGRPTSVY